MKDQFINNCKAKIDEIWADKKITVREFIEAVKFLIVEVDRLLSISGEEKAVFVRDALLYFISEYKVKSLIVGLIPVPLFLKPLISLIVPAILSLVIKAVYEAIRK